MDKTIRPSQKSIPKSRIFAQFESFAAIPDPKYGDSYSKLKQTIPSLLTNLGLPAEHEDIRAAVILSHGQIDINSENISRIKELDGKIRALSDSLHPRIAATMLSEGLNPLDTPIDSLQSYVDSFANVYSKGYESSEIQRAINGIEPIVQSGIIAIYRALHTISRNDGAALGIAYRSGKTKTLGSILSAASSLKEVNFAIDDETPINETVLHEDSIRNVIDRACSLSRTLLTT